MIPAVTISFFAVVLCAIGAAGYVFVVRPAKSGAEEPHIPAPISLDRDLPGPLAGVFHLLRLIGEAVPGGNPENAGVRQKLASAGYRWPSAVSVFLGIKYATALMLGTACAWAAVTFADVDLSGLFLPGICGLGFGYMIPDRVLSRLAAGRATRLRQALPAAVDLMVLAVEAGQGVDAAIADASRGLRVSYPDMALEFTFLQLEMRANTSRLDALRNFVARTREPEIRKFAGLLIDTDRFGTSLGPALRAHGKYLRVRFRQSAQERARKVAVKLIFPVFFLIFPSVMLVTLGPAVILLMTQMSHILGI